MTLEDKNVGILVEDLFEDIELLYPYYRLREAGVHVELIAPSTDKKYHSKHGYPIQPTLEAEKAISEQFDGLIIPGGYSPDRMRRNADMVALVADVATQGGIVAAICHGPWMLCSAGVLAGRRSTGFCSIKDDVVNAGAQWIDAEVVHDGNIITSRCPDDLPAFMRSFIEALTASYAHSDLA